MDYLTKREDVYGFEFLHHPNWVVFLFKTLDQKLMDSHFLPLDRDGAYLALLLLYGKKFPVECNYTPRLSLF